MSARIARSTHFLAFGLVLAACIMIPRHAHSGVWEISAGFSYSRSNYSNENFSWNRRWGASVGYHFTESSEIELSFQDVMDRTKIDGYEDTTFHDQIYSVNWVQTLVGKGASIEPYVKFGIGQLNREATGTYAGGASPPAILDSVTAILGAGVKVHITRGVGLRCEGSTYLTNGMLKSWEDNLAFSSGLSFYF